MLAEKAGARFAAKEKALPSGDATWGVVSHAEDGAADGTEHGVALARSGL
jgi:hypothetical protein